MEEECQGATGPPDCAFAGRLSRAIADIQGGSVKGTTLQYGGFGIRLLEQVRLTAAQLKSAQAALKRKIKPVKGAEVHLRVFPDIPVCVKGNETRMGKGKGTFEYWACRVPAGRVVFEIAGGGIREEIAKQALKLAQVKMPVQTEFISTSTPRRLGNLVGDFDRPPAAQKTVRGPQISTPGTQSQNALEAKAAAEAQAKIEQEEAAKIARV